MSQALSKPVTRPGVPVAPHRSPATAPEGARPWPSPSTSRLLRHNARSLADHLAVHGPLPTNTTPTDFARELERSGLTGRGGAGFPAARKAAGVVGRGRAPLLVVNAMEGEPAAFKDRVLLEHAPHIVLDGAVALAGLIGASRVVVAMPKDRTGAARTLAVAIEERAGLPGPEVPMDIALLEPRYVAGEESALVAALTGAVGVPRFRPDKSVPLQVGRRPALVHNAETVGHAGLIARHGAAWFRQVGAPEAPGTSLVSVSGALSRPGVFEVATGSLISDIIAAAAPTSEVQAVLLGGFGGSWVPAADLATPFSPQALLYIGASMGAGVMLVLGKRSCGLRETLRIARFMAAESAGQCGPCLFGLPAICSDLGEICAGTAGPTTLERLLLRCSAVAGRGACRHPDGAVRVVRSALEVFRTDLAAHMAGRPCSAGGGA